jgi:hypothetical protein
MTNTYQFISTHIAVCGNLAGNESKLKSRITAQTIDFTGASMRDRTAGLRFTRGMVWFYQCICLHMYCYGLRSVVGVFGCVSFWIYIDLCGKISEFVGTGWETRRNR